MGVTSTTNGHDGSQLHSVDTNTHGCPSPWLYHFLASPFRESQLPVLRVAIFMHPFHVVASTTLIADSEKIYSHEEIEATAMERVMINNTGILHVYYRYIIQQTGNSDQPSE